MEWPHPPMVVQTGKDERYTHKAWSQDAVVLGYDVHGRPWPWPDSVRVMQGRSEEHTSELQSHLNLVCRLLLEKKKITEKQLTTLPLNCGLQPVGHTTICSRLA